MGRKIKKENHKYISSAIGIVLVVVLVAGVFAGGFFISDGLTVCLDGDFAIEKAQEVYNDFGEDVLTELEEEPVAEEEMTEDLTTGTIADSTSAPTTSKKPTTEAKKGLNKSSLKEVVSYYNESANKVKSAPAKSVTWVYEDINLDEEYTKIPKGLNIFMDLVNSALKADKKNEKYTCKEDIIKVFAVESETWSSKLTSDAVKEFSCTEENGDYKIKLVLKDEPNLNVGHGEGYAGKAFYVLKIDDIKRGPVEEASLDYYDCTINCVIDKETGNMKEVTYKMPMIMGFKAMGLSAEVGVTIEKQFAIEW